MDLPVLQSLLFNNSTFSTGHTQSYCDGTDADVVRGDVVLADPGDKSLKNFEYRPQAAAT